MENIILGLCVAILALSMISAGTSLVAWIVGIVKSKSKARVENIKNQIQKYENMLNYETHTEIEKEFIKSKLEELKSQVKM